MQHKKIRGPQIVIKKSPWEMLQGIGLDTKQIQRVTLAIGNAVKISFTERCEQMTQSELDRRAAYSVGEVLKMICEWEFAIAEVERQLPVSLRCHLIGIEYQPSERLLAGHKTL
jgi:hypothetical protein